MSTDSDQTINCRDCNQPFVFTAGEAKFFAERQFTTPSRCKPCRDKRKAAKEAGESPGSFNPSGGYTTSAPIPSPEGQGDGPPRSRRGGGGGRGRRGQDGYGD